MATSSGTYVYCLLKSDRKPSLLRAPGGLPFAGPLRLFEGAAGAWIVVSDVPLSRYGADAINAHLQNLEWLSARALAHEAVVEFFARTHDVVPMKLFTIFRDDERARAQVGSARALAGVFRRIAGCSEWSVRLACAPGVVAEAAGRRVTRHGRGAGESGTSFLHRKKLQQDEVRKAALAARGAVDRVFRRLDGIAKESVRKPSDVPGSQLVLDAAFLVPRRRRGTFQREAARLAAVTSKAGCELVLSGPWPAYHFVGGN